LGYCNYCTVIRNAEAVTIATRNVFFNSEGVRDKKHAVARSGAGIIICKGSSHPVPCAGRYSRPATAGFELPPGVRPGAEHALCRGVGQGSPKPPAVMVEGFG
jgi:hypothetical protein